MGTGDLLIFSLIIATLIMLPVIIIWAFLPIGLYKKTVVRRIGLIFSILGILIFIYIVGLTLWFILASITCRGEGCAQGIGFGIFLFLLPAIGIAVLSGPSAFLIISKSKKALQEEKISSGQQKSVFPTTRIATVFLILGLLIASVIVFILWRVLGRY